MTKPVLLYYDILNYARENLDLLNRQFQVILLDDPSQDTAQALQEADAVIAPLGYYFGKEKVDRCTNLKVIGSNTTGHPHIDVAYAQKKGIRVVTLKTEETFLRTITPTAELTWGLVIALTRNLVPAVSSVKEGKWSRWPYGGETMLSRMQLGIAGLGRLGTLVAHYGACFGMTVQYYDPFVVSEQPDIRRAGTLEELVAGNDVISVHIPHEKETEKLFDRSVFSRFKPGSFFVNTARGEIVDETALVDALMENRIAGAAVDVLDGEFEPDFEDRMSDHPLIRYAKQHDNLILTPHIGGSTRDAWRLTQENTIRMIISALKD